MSRTILFASILGLVAVGGVIASPVAMALDFFSWEDGTAQGWDGNQNGQMFAQIGPSIATAKTVADGVPAAAITDGIYALEIAHPNNGNWSQIVRAHGGFEPNFTDPVYDIHDDLSTNTTMEFDLYIPASTVPPDVDIIFDPINNPNNKFYQFEVSIEGRTASGGLAYNFTQKFVQDGFDFLPGATQDLPTDTSIHIVYEYTAKPQWNTTAVATQITFNSQLGDQFGDIDSCGVSTECDASPWYVDNFQFTGGGILGDFDDDEDVDGADFLKWQRDGLSSNDLDDWQMNFGTGTGPLEAVSAVPEPASIVLFATAACGLAIARQRKPLPSLIR